MGDAPSEHGGGGGPGAAGDALAAGDDRPSPEAGLHVGRRLAVGNVPIGAGGIAVRDGVGQLAAQERGHMASQVRGVVRPGAGTLVRLRGGAVRDIGLDQLVDGHHLAGGPLLGGRIFTVAHAIERPKRLLPRRVRRPGRTVRADRIGRLTGAEAVADCIDLPAAGADPEDEAFDLGVPHPRLTLGRGRDRIHRPLRQLRLVLRHRAAS